MTIYPPSESFSTMSPSKAPSRTKLAPLWRIGAVPVELTQYCARLSSLKLKVVVSQNASEVCEGVAEEPDAETMEGEVPVGGKGDGWRCGGIAERGIPASFVWVAGVRITDVL